MLAVRQGSASDRFRTDMFDVFFFFRSYLNYSFPTNYILEEMFGYKCVLYDFSCSNTSNDRNPYCR